MQIPSTPPPSLRPLPVGTHALPIPGSPAPEPPLRGDAVSDLHHLFPAVEETPVQEAPAPVSAPVTSPAQDPGFAPGARQKLQASIGGAGNSLLNQEHVWPAPTGAPPAWSNPAPYAGMLVNPHAGAAAMPQVPVPPAGPSFGSRVKQAAQRLWDFGMSGGLIGQARRNRQAGAPQAPQPFGAPQSVHAPQTLSAPVPVGPPQVRVQVGDITALPAQALITPINSEGMWWGGIDGAIQKVAGGQFHGQASEVLNRSGLTEGQTVLAEARQPHHGAFQDVLFVVDDGGKPLREIVLEGLRSADRAGLQSVSLPAMRTGVMAGREGPGSAVREMAAGIKQFLAENPGNVRDIQVAVYKDPALARAYQDALA